MLTRDGECSRTSPGLKPRLGRPCNNFSLHLKLVPCSIYSPPLLGWGSFSDSYFLKCHIPGKTADALAPHVFAPTFLSKPRAPLVVLSGDLLTIYALTTALTHHSTSYCVSPFLSETQAYNVLALDICCLSAPFTPHSNCHAASSLRL